MPTSTPKTKKLRKTRKVKEVKSTKTATKIIDCPEKNVRTPEKGDLVFCHIIGSAHGWYIDQLGLVTENKIRLLGKEKLKHSPTQNILDASTNTMSQNIYDIYLFELEKKMHATNKDFETGDIEVISGLTKQSIEELKKRVNTLRKSMKNQISVSDTNITYDLGDGSK